MRIETCQVCLDEVAADWLTDGMCAKCILVECADYMDRAAAEAQRIPPRNQVCTYTLNRTCVYCGNDVADQARMHAYDEFDHHARCFREANGRWP